MSITHKLFCIGLLFLGAFPVYAEEITDFSAVYQIQQDGTVRVTETISYDFKDAERHGIFRVLQTNHPQEATAWYKKRSIQIDVGNVTTQDGAVPYEVSKSASKLEIKVGDPDVTITGLQVYTISYLLTGALSYGDQGAEFYYNVTGNAWQVPLSIVSATILDPTGTLFSSSSACYVGNTGDTASCIKGTQKKSVAEFRTTNLVAGSGLTIAQSLNAQNLAVLVHETVALNWLLYIFGGLWLLGLFVWAYRYRTQFKIHKPIIAQYEPYKKLLPLYTGVLFDGKLDPKDITAGIVHLADQGIIKIRQTTEKVLWIFTTTDYEITLLKIASSVSDDGLKQLLTLLFPMSALPNTTMKLSSLTESDKSKNAKIIAELQEAYKAKLATDGFLVVYRLLQTTALKTLLLVTIVGAIALFASVWFAVVLFGIGLCVVIYLQDYRLRTIKGNEALNHLKGFRLFLSVTEQERYKFHNAPQKSPEQFMEFLPYAVAFGVEKDWEKVFEGIAIPTPQWYEGNASGAFVASSFANDIQSFSAALTGATRVSNSSNGSFGSSGGGFSGGGGGGGGGGSW